MTLISFLLGVSVGFVVGIALLALAIAAGDADTRLGAKEGQ